MSNFYDHVVKYRVSEGLVVNEKWRELVTNFEGLRLDSYQDTGGVWTIGYGHTLTAQPNMRITEDRANELLYEDVERFEEGVNDLVEVPLTQYQFNALVSFSFNVGVHALSTSTLLKKLNRGEYAGAAEEFDRWVYDNGQRLRGLVRRRKAEREMFLGHDWVSDI